MTADRALVWWHEKSKKTSAPPYVHFIVAANNAVQAEIERRKKLGRPLSCESPLSAKLICGDCGGYFGPKVWGSNTKYRRVIWRCNEKYKGGKRCTTPHLTEEEVKEKFIEAFNSMSVYREEIIANCRLAQGALCYSTEIDAELEELHREIEIVAELSRKAIYENAHVAIDQKEWHERNNGYLERHRRAMGRVAELEKLKRERKNKSLMLEGFIQKLEFSGETLAEFDEGLWTVTIDKVTVQADGTLMFNFKDGTEIE